MNEEMQKAFEDFRAALNEGGGTTLYDVLIVPVSFMLEGQHPIAFSILAHMADVASENDRVSHADLLAESYRRAFCDRAQAAKYGTQRVADDEPAALALLQHLTEAVRSPSAGSYEPAEIALTLKADTGNAH